MNPAVSLNWGAFGFYRPSEEPTEWGQRYQKLQNITVILGYIPGVSIFIGVARIGAVTLLSNQLDNFTEEEKHALVISSIIRAVFEILCLSLLLALIVDPIVTYNRYKKVETKPKQEANKTATS